MQKNRKKLSISETLKESELFELTCDGSNEVIPLEDDDLSKLKNANQAQMWGHAERDSNAQ